MTPASEPKTVADLLELLERGKIGYGYAMRWLGIDSLDELWEIAALNDRRLPGHKPGRVSQDTIELLKSLPRRRDGNPPVRHRKTAPQRTRKRSA
jgi:hypothetical protein